MKIYNITIRAETTADMKTLLELYKDSHMYREFSFEDIMKIEYMGDNQE